MRLGLGPRVVSVASAGVRICWDRLPRGTPQHNVIREVPQARLFTVGHLNPGGRGYIEL